MMSGSEAQARGTAQVRQPSAVAIAVQTAAADASISISWTRMWLPSGARDSETVHARRIRGPGDGLIGVVADAAPEARDPHLAPVRSAKDLVAEVEPIGGRSHRTAADAAVRVPVGVADRTRAVGAVDGFAAVEPGAAGHLVPVADMLTTIDGVEAMRVLLAAVRKYTAPAMPNQEAERLKAGPDPRRGRRRLRGQGGCQQGRDHSFLPCMRLS
jgi:hypothetical protein